MTVAKIVLFQFFMGFFFFRVTLRGGKKKNEERTQLSQTLLLCNGMVEDKFQICPV